MSFAVVIPAAGSGSRMGSSVPKVLLEIAAEGSASRSILRRTVDVFSAEPSCVRIVVCVPAEWQDRCMNVLSGVRDLSIVAGGPTRQDSVRLGIQCLVSLSGITPKTPVLVHDAARCCVSSELIARVAQGVLDHGAVTAAVKVVDALCSVDSDHGVSHHVDRESLWSVQTPQGFVLEDLELAHRRAREEGVSALDDASLVARLRPVRVVPGERFNIKVTEPADMQLAQLVMRL